VGECYDEKRQKERTRILAEPIISVSGLRGVVGDTLTPEVAIRYAAAFAATLPPGDVLIGRDSRPSGRMLSLAIQAGLQAVGRSTLDAGIVATPTAGVLLRHHAAAGAIQITASHNPAPYNGLKLFSAEGRVIPAAPGRQVLERYRTGTPAWLPQDRLGHVERCEDTVTAHLLAVLETIDAERIRKQRFRVLLDSNHGAGSILGRRLLHELACRVTVLGEEPNGQFAHPAEPTAENLAGVLAAVNQSGADVGFCQDPDADRLAVIDAAGRYLGEEYTLAMCVDHVLRQRQAGTGPFFGGKTDLANKPSPENMDLSPSAAIAANCASSRMSQDLAERYGVPYFRSAVGEANVVDAMIAHHAVFGGEGNGGPIDPRVGYVRDSFVGMAQLLDAMAARQMSIAQLADELPRYEIVKTKISLPPQKLPSALDALEKRFADAASDRLDGLRLDWPGRWLLVRGSNTEPIVRAIAEAPTAAEATSLCEAAATVLAAV
jgi:phosphomannomutase